MSFNVAIQVINLGKCYQIYAQPKYRLRQFILPRIYRFLGFEARKYAREFWALNDVTFEVKKGETVGIIGRNGSGKSTLLQLISGTLNPTCGAIHVNGRIAALLELGSGFNTEFTGLENIYMNGAILGLRREEIDARLHEIIAFADIGPFVEQPVKTYSSGMMVRLAFSVAINVSPDILIIDEALAVGDAAFQRKCMRKINELSESGVTLLFVSHDIETVKKICNKAIYFSQGSIRDYGEAKEVCISYERDLFGGSKGADIIVDLADNSIQQNDEEILDPDLLKVDEKIYGDGRAEIFDISIYNNDKKRINVIKSSAPFTISYQVRFLDSSPFPKFGMMLTTREGICVFGTNTENHPISSHIYEKGNEVTIEFHLINNLAPGTYYLTCGVHSPDSDDGLIYLQRRMDSMMIKSIADHSLRIGGLADLKPRIHAI